MSFSSEFRLPSKFFLYDEPSTGNFKLNEIADYIEERTGLKVEPREGFLQHNKPENADELAKRFASCKVRNIEKWEEHEPLYGEVNIEKRLITDPKFRLPGILYEGMKLQRIFQSLIPQDERSIGNLHLVFTNRLFTTFDDDDRRFHARVILCGYPSLISTSGIVEAPARPKGFYAAKQKLSSVGIEAVDMIKEEYKDEIIDYDDERLTEVLKGYAMQALFYHATGEPFCEIGKCRLFNAHWQSEVMEAQLGGDLYCPRHEKMLEKVRHGTGTQ
ncbi:MAG: hypothetical protein KAI64_00985 [Thermoplasmata archaeon]|nr:hypothetical protein [Thermoplasmata archaeon]